MRKLIAVAVLLVLVSGANYFPGPDPSGYFDRIVLCRWLGAGEREVRMWDAVDDESPCPRLLPAPHTYSNQNNCAVKCNPAAIIARIVERTEAAAAAIQESVQSLFAARSQS